jgi:hypothetical protein
VKDCYVKFAKLVLSCGSNNQAGVSYQKFDIIQIMRMQGDFPSIAFSFLPPRMHRMYFLPRDERSRDTCWSIHFCFREYAMNNYCNGLSVCVSECRTVQILCVRVERRDISQPAGFRVRHHVAFPLSLNRADGEHRGHASAANINKATAGGLRDLGLFFRDEVCVLSKEIAQAHLRNLTVKFQLNLRGEFFRHAIQAASVARDAEPHDFLLPY